MADQEIVRLLLVEDSIHDVVALKRALHAGAAETFLLDHVERAEAALELLNGFGPGADIVVFDYDLPGMNGLEAGKEVASRWPDTPVVLLTGAGSEELAVEALKAGFSDYVVKDPRANYLDILPAKLLRVVRQSSRNKEFREIQERYRRLVENSPAIHYSFSEIDEGFYVSRRVEDILGYTPDELRNNPYIWYDSIDPAHKPVVDEAIARFRERKHFSTEYRIQRKDGAWVWLRDLSIQFGKEDDDFSLEGMAIDITKEKQLEELKSDIQRVTSHDLRSPVAGIISITELMIHDMEEECAMHATMIHKAGLRILDMLNKSHNLYKLEQNTLEVNMRPLDLDKVISSAVNEVLSEPRRKKRNVHVESCGAEIHADETLLWSVINNLVSNALEADQVGKGVRVTCALGEGSVSVSIHNAQAIPEELQEQFFDKYQTFGKQHGTGLGTYSAKLMTEAMGGAISVESSEKEGTTVQLLFKAKPA